MWRIFVSSLIASVVAVPLTVVHESRGSTDLHASWKTSNIDRNAVVSVRVGLTQRNLDRGYDHVMDVSDPDSENYGKHWTLEEVNAEFAPADESVDLVTAWLKSSGIKNARQTSNRGWIIFDAPVHQVEKLLSAKYQEYQSRNGVTRIGCDRYSLPQHLAPHIDYITPAVKLSPPVRITKASDDNRIANKSQPAPTGPPAQSKGLPPDLQNCSSSITGACYRALYNIPSPGKFNISAGQIGIFEEGDTYAQADLDAYFAKFAPYVPNGTAPTLYGINGATAPVPQSEDGSESDIDFTIVYSLLGGVNVSLYQSVNPLTYKYNFESTLVDPLLDAIDGSYCSKNETEAGFQCGSYPLAKVLSGSYSPPELFYTSLSSQVRSCNEFMKLSLQGHTIVFASGDYGVASDPAYYERVYVDNGCVAQNLNNTSDSPKNIFAPTFPSNCPYVLSVGATQIVANHTVHDPEVLMNQPGLGYDSNPPDITFSSAGGFSNYFARPSYQDDAVQEYLKTHVPKYPYYKSNLVDVQSKNTTIGSNKGVYNRNGRGFPDVSANGVRAAFVFRGKVAHTVGTSLAAPVWASIITMLNAERTAAGRSPVGFVHPILYKNPQAFNDITAGNNSGCHSNGFSAVKGWDPASGLGTPNYTKLSEVFASPPGYSRRK